MPSRPVLSALVVLALFAPESVAAEPANVGFTTEVVPTLTKLGCNTGGCHGKAEGQNGFRLSLFGFEPQDDFESIVKDARGRRVFAAAPAQSLLVLQASGSVAHAGGKRLDLKSDAYALLKRWIAEGAPPSPANASRFSREARFSTAAGSCRRRSLRTSATARDAM